MNIAAPAAPRSESHRLLITVLVVLAAGLLWFLHTKLHYANYSLASYTDYYWPRRGALAPHIVGGVLASMAGLVQIWLGLTNRTGAWHHALGKVYGTAVLIGGAGGMYLSLTVPSGHLPYSAGLFMLSVAWLLTTAMALYAIRSRHVQQHREWMLRSYTVTFAFVTFRLLDRWLHTWITVPQDLAADSIDTLMAWACWAVPLLLAEPLIHLRAMRTASVAAS